MADTKFDVLTVGNAIVDVLASCDDQFLTDNDITKGAMNLIDANRSAALFTKMGHAQIISGGSAANTAVGVAALGGNAAYFGKTCRDDNGALYASDMKAQGVHFATPPLETAPPTATSMIFVTPDGERSMNTYLGACVELGVEDIDKDVVQNSQITYFEGYLWDPPRAKDAIRLACEIAHQAGRKTAITLSDTFCVDRYRDEFINLIQSGTVDIVFANHGEVQALYQASDFNSALDALANDCELGIVTHGAKGSITVKDGQRLMCPAYPTQKLKDTTGAGDLFAAGFLFGISHNFTLEQAAHFGNFAAKNVIEQIGPRPFGDLRQLAEQADLFA